MVSESLRSTQHARLIRTGALIFAIALAVAGQGFWEKKNYSEWSEAECHKLLRDSPWARVYQQTSVHLVPIGAEAPNTRREPTPQHSYFAQFRTAHPVRQAIVRLRQIQRKYDTLAPESKRAFDEQSSQFLDQKFDDRIVVTVTFQSNVDGTMRDAARIWQSATIEQLRNEVFLNAGKGRKAELMRYSFAGTGGQCEFHFEFARTLNGEPLVNPEEKSINLEFRHPEVSQFPAARVFIEFKLNSMNYKGALTL